MLELDETEVIARVWAELGRGVRDRRSAWHCPTLVTCDPEGVPWPTTVVLRAADAAAGTLLCHTRADAGKVRRLADDARAAWHVYDRPAKVQVRLWGTAEVHREGPVAEAR